MSVLALAAALALAQQCAPTVAPGTLLSVARTESALDPLTVHDNMDEADRHLPDVASAVQVATRLIAAGHSIDLGLMQINSQNLSWLHMSIAETFDTCLSMRAGATVLVQGYHGGQSDAEQQQALRQALSSYNTGNPTRGFRNGYVHLVEASAQHIIPEIRVAGDVAPSAPVAPVPVDPNAPPSWDVWGHAEYLERQKAEQPPAPSPTPQPAPTLAPSSASASQASRVVFSPLHHQRR